MRQRMRCRARCVTLGKLGSALWNEFWPLKAQLYAATGFPMMFGRLVSLGVSKRFGLFGMWWTASTRWRVNLGWLKLLRSPHSQNFNLAPSEGQKRAPKRGRRSA